MDFNGFQWVLMDFNGFKSDWIPIECDFDGFWWMFWWMFWWVLMDFDSELVLSQCLNVSTIFGFCVVSLSLSPFHSHPVVNAPHDLSEASEASAAANHVKSCRILQSCKTFTWWYMVILGYIGWCKPLINWDINCKPWFIGRLIGILGYYMVYMVLRCFVLGRRPRSKREQLKLRGGRRKGPLWNVRRKRQRDGNATATRQQPHRSLMFAYFLMDWYSFRW